MPLYALGNRTPTIHPDAFIHPDAVVIGDVHVGADSSVWPSAVLRGDYGTIIVGERTSIQDGAIIHAVPDFPTVIGSDCVVGHLAHLEGCVIEDRALVGSGSVVLHQATVHSGATVGAGAVVRNRMDVPANALASRQSSSSATQKATSVSASRPPKKSLQQSVLPSSSPSSPSFPSAAATGAPISVNHTPSLRKNPASAAASQSDLSLLRVALVWLLHRL